MFTMSCNMKKPKQNLTTNSKGKEKKEKNPQYYARKICKTFTTSLTGLSRFERH